MKLLNFIPILNELFKKIKGGEYVKDNFKKRKRV